MRSIRPTQQKKVTDAIQNAYRYCFKSNISNQNKNWVPHTVCANCYRILITCHNSQNTSNLKFISPVVWGKPKSRNDCFFCLTITKGFNSKNKNKINYIYPSNVMPASFIETNSGCPKKSISDIEEAMDVDDDFSTSSSKESEESHEESSASDQDYKKTKGVPQRFNQDELN